MSKPKLTLTMGAGGPVYKVAPPFDGADHAVVEGLDACPGCKAKAPVKVAGSGRRIESHDTYAADAVTLCCKGWVGTLRAKCDTLFGLEEDEAIGRLGVRIY